MSDTIHTKGAQAEKPENITQMGFPDHSEDFFFFFLIGTFLINLGNDAKRSQQHMVSQVCTKKITLC